VEDFLKRVKTEFLEAIAEKNAQSLKDFEDIKVFNSNKSTRNPIQNINKVPQVEAKQEEDTPKQVPELKATELNHTGADADADVNNVDSSNAKEHQTNLDTEIEDKLNDLDIENQDKEIVKDSKTPIDLEK